MKTGLGYAIETLEIERYRLLGLQRSEEIDEREHLLSQLGFAISTLAIEADKTPEDVAAETQFWTHRKGASK